MRIFTTLLTFGSTVATATADATSATVVVVTITSGGQYYTSAPTVTLTGGSGSYSSATATISGGVVTGVTVTGATGYTIGDTPTVAFTAPTGAVQINRANTQPVAASTFDVFPKANRIYVEPLASNTATSYVGVSTVASNGTGVISELPKPALASVSLRPNSWDLVDHNGQNTIDLTQFYFTGTANDSVKVSYYVV